MVTKIVVVLIIALASCATAEPGIFLLPEGEVIACQDAVDAPGCLDLRGCGVNKKDLGCWPNIVRISRDY